MMRLARNPVAFFSNGLGDHILALPSVRCLNTIFEEKLVLVTRRGPGARFFHEVPLRQIIEIDIWDERDERTFNVFSLINRIPCCDLFISLVPWCSASIRQVVEHLPKASSIGFYFDCFDSQIEVDQKRHCVDNTFDICRHIDPSRVVDDYVGPLSHDESAKAEARLLDLPRDCRLMVIHCDTQPHKCWDNERWRVFIDTFLNRYQNFYVAIVGLSGDRFPEYARLIDCTDTSLSTAVAITASADLFVGVDSCMLHAADFARVPSVGLFGPTDPRRFGCRVTLYCRHVVSSTTRMADIPVVEVLTGVDDLISTLGLSDSQGSAFSNPGGAVQEP